MNLDVETKARAIDLFAVRQEHQPLSIDHTYIYITIIFIFIILL